MHPFFSALLAASLAGPVVQVADRIDSGRPPFFAMPDGSAIPFPQGPSSTLREPTDVVPRADAKPSAEATLSRSERRKRRTDDLFDRLAKAKDETEAGAISLMLTHVWLQSGSDTADLLMERAMTAIGARDNATAGQLLDKIIALQPGWAEAWNKRATIRYLDDDDAGSMEDISHVLAIEPRHFGALSGMGFILHRNGDDKAALAVLRRAAAVNPQATDVKTLIDQLIPDVEGHDL